MEDRYCTIDDYPKGIKATYIYDDIGTDISQTVCQSLFDIHQVLKR